MELHHQRSNRPVVSPKGSPVRGASYPCDKVMSSCRTAAEHKSEPIVLEVADPNPSRLMFVGMCVTYGRRHLPRCRRHGLPRRRKADSRCRRLPRPRRRRVCPTVTALSVIELEPPASVCGSSVRKLPYRRGPSSLRSGLPLTSDRRVRSCPTRHGQRHVKSAESSLFRWTPYWMNECPATVEIGYRSSSEYVRPLGFEPRTCGLRVASRACHAVARGAVWPAQTSSQAWHMPPRVGRCCTISRQIRGRTRGGQDDGSHSSVPAHCRKVVPVGGSPSARPTTTPAGRVARDPHS
jgi:hypothetical protein